jgi:hypothetical protein
MWMVKTRYLAPSWGITTSKRELVNRTDVYYAMQHDRKMRVVKVFVVEVPREVHPHRRKPRLARVASGAGRDTDSIPSDGRTGPKQDG